MNRASYEDAFSTDSSFFPWYVASLKSFVNIVKEIEGFEEIAKSLSKWTPDVMMSSYFVPKAPMKCGFKVLNHGDDWVNNMMFKVNEDGSTESVKFLDFQVSYWGGPAGDLYYFLLTSVHDDIKIEHYDELIEYYHTELVESLKKLSFDGYIPTFEEINADLVDKKQYGNI